MQQTFDQLVELVKNTLGVGDLVTDVKATPHALVLSPQQLVPVCQALYQHPNTYFDMLTCITGIDNGAQANTMEVVYNLYSVPFNHAIMLRVSLPRTAPVISTVSTIWRGADWLEREVFDMYGIQFEGHPDLRRILLPADWEGYPLRKDYQQQERYRNMTVAYEKS
jgi:NADH-quinone oxidoreductase subunit C